MHAASYLLVVWRDIHPPAVPSMRVLLTPTKLWGRCSHRARVGPPFLNLIFMYLIAIGWIYVTLLMAIAEAANTNGSVLGAVITFLLYGVGPTALLMYILGTPARRRARRALEQAEPSPPAEQASAAAPAPSSQPDAGSQAAADPVATVREKK
jgi:hypothetical protein